MKTPKQKMLRAFFLVEIVLFSYVFYAGAYGILSIRKIEKENELLLQKVAIAKEAVSYVKEELACWQKEPFLKEKIARERLQMARKNDLIFFIE